MFWLDAVSVWNMLDAIDLHGCCASIRVLIKRQRKKTVKDLGVHDLHSVRFHLLIFLGRSERNWTKKKRKRIERKNKEK